MCVYIYIEKKVRINSRLTCANSPSILHPVPFPPPGKKNRVILHSSSAQADRGEKQMKKMAAQSA